MSDEELFQCPNNPNHLVPRSQIDEHVNTCKLLMDPNQEMQMTSSDEEIRSLTSHQWSLQEESSQQGGSQLATLPISEGTSTQEWRSPLKPGMQVTSPNRFQMQKPYAKLFQSSETSSETDIDLSGSECSSDNQSRLQMTDTRTKKYIKIISTRSKSLKKLTLDSHTDDTSSSSSDSTFSLYDTMPDKEKKIIQNLGEEYIKQTSPASQEESSSQQATSSQQAASSPQETILQPAKLTLKKEDEKMEVKSRVSLSSSSLPQVSTLLEVPMDESSLSEDVSQEKSTSISSYDETGDDSDDTQRLRRKRKMKHKEMDTKETTEEETSRLPTEVTTPLEVQMEVSSLSEEVSQEQTEQVSPYARTKDDSDNSQKQKMISKKKHEKKDTEEKIEAEASHLWIEETTRLEVETEEPSLSGDVSKEQSQPASSSTETREDLDDSQRQIGSRKEKYAEISIEENVHAEETHILAEKTTLEEVETKEPSLSRDVPQQQLPSVSSPAETKHELDFPQKASRSRKRSHARTNIETGNLQEEVCSQQADSSEVADSSQREVIKKRKHSDSYLTTDEDKSKKIGLKEPFLSVPEEQPKPVVSCGKTKHESDVPQSAASRLRKRSYEATESKIVNLDEPGCSYQTHSSQEADSSQKKKRKVSDSSSSSD